MNTATTARPVRVHLAMKDGPLPRSIRQVLLVHSSESLFVYVKKADDADLIIFTDVSDIEKGFTKEKSYAFLKMLGQVEVPILPSNCTIIGVERTLATLIELISSLHKRLEPLAVEVASPQSAVVSLGPNALHVLVIDDTPANIASAKSSLAGHYLTTVNGYQDAMDVLGREKFDVVLTDLHLPMSSRTMGDKFRLGELVPYGILLMVEAARQGAKHVAVVTDLSHHDDPFSAAFDHFSRFPVKIDGAKVVMMHAPMKDSVKDWKMALSQLMKE